MKNLVDSHPLILTFCKLFNTNITSQKIFKSHKQNCKQIWNV